ncbi:hypothetical protein EDB83DRAFT_2507869 [Lactarius deliciosus]|nr:hypothetical protein EDB83DRAFT_2507869 [Lactarius deliciosus]
MTSTTHRAIDDEGTLDEQYVQDAFHSYLKSSLAQAKAERLLDIEVLSSAEGDLMITGPALCLFFAALRCTTNPPSVPLPRGGSGAEKSGPRQSLSLANCPATFVPFMRLWSECVPAIQSLAPERQHDLARVICNLAPLEKPAPPPVVPRLAADLRAIAIEISLRRSFQDRYASDLQAAIDVGESTGGPGSLRTKASFVPPPLYTPSPTTLSPTPLEKSRRSPTLRTTPSPISPLLPPRSPLSPSASVADARRSPTIAGPTSPAIELIRETLYAALADVLASTPRLHAQLTHDPPRAYYGSVALAILAVSARSVAADGDDGGAVWLVRGTRLTVAECPEPLRPLMREFVAIGVEAALIEEEDTAAAIALAQEGRTVPVPRIERARLVLERGAGYDIREGEERDSGGRRSAEGRAVAFANRVNALALSMTRLPQFRERQAEVFRVLAAVGGGHSS